MSFKTKKIEPTDLDKAIANVFSEMQGFSADQAEYAKMVDQLNKLHAMRQSEKTAKPRVSPEALLAVVGNLAGIVMILGYEKMNIVTSKALTFVLKSKV